MPESERRQAYPVGAHMRPSISCISEQRALSNATKKRGNDHTATIRLNAALSVTVVQWTVVY